MAHIAFKLGNGNIYHTSAPDFIEVYDESGNFEGLVFSRESVSLPENYSPFYIIKKTLAEFFSETVEYDLLGGQMVCSSKRVYIDLIPYDKNPFAIADASERRI